ncbi:MAG: hypothetical protein KC910_24140 [Candidatus Eremiobacteraeota bacterium]|nr:hypothetical protein [Candidatus Eremiobacteraeota bacterium]
MASSIEQYLVQQAAAGRLEDAGEFTIDPETAWRKLGSFQLPDPEAWVLKLVQAGVAGQAAEMSVHQTRQSSRFVVVGVPDWSFETVLEALFQLKAQSGSALDHLATAIRTLVTQSERRVELVFPSGQAVAWNGLVFTDQDPRAPSVRFELVVDHLPLAGSDRSERARYTAALSRQLSEHCYYCPVPLRLDGRPVSRPRPKVAYLPLPDQHERPSLLPNVPTLASAKASHWELGEDGWNGPYDFFKFELKGRPEASPNPAAALVLEYDIRPGMRLAGYRSERFYPVESNLCWFQHGVIITREKWGVVSKVFGLEVAIDASGLETDLSGLQLLESEAKSTRYQQTMKAAQTALGALEGEFSASFEPTGPWGWLKQTKTDFGHPLLTLLIWLLFGLLFVALFPIFVLGILTTILMSYWKRARQTVLTTALTQQKSLFQEQGLKALRAFIDEQTRR